MKLKILLGVAALVLLAATVVGTLFLSGAMDSSETVAGTDAPSLAAATKLNQPIFYHNIQPEFVINFHRKQRPRALMLEISVSSFNEKVLDTLDSHSPELRNNLLLLMTENDGSSLYTAVGKNTLRDEIKVALNELLTKHGDGESVENVFFTRFVLQ